MWISELAEHAGVAARTVRFYEEQGLLTKPERTHAGYRDYDDATVERLLFIKSAKSLGLTLFDIGRVLELADTDERPCGRVEAMVDAKVAEIDQRIVELQVLRARLCSLDASQGGEASVCPIIEHAR
ncbi:MAG: heavy metal-responsive transcriptional regulator [Acidimicrobiales bacterium]|nr:heavy metal-responsive transcriptional regulator [Acidimicrobiales bacterium]